MTIATRTRRPHERPQIPSAAPEGCSPEDPAPERGSLLGATLSVFSDAELAYLGERRLGRLATVDSRGLPHVVPLGWRYNPEHDTIDVTGRNLSQTAKFRHASANPNVALVVDDVLPPWRPRAVEVRGRAEVITDAVGSGGEPLGALIRIHPLKVISWGLQEASR